ncbi:MAG: FecR domain-containing protein, partial [Myxococcales bacterium]|nr:FecR domain-containing protein [Myxococcales bacterium]
MAPRLRELDEVLAERGMPPAARARVEVRLRQEAQRRAALTGFRLRWLPALTFAAGAALVLMVVGLRVFQGTASPEAVASRVLGIFTVQGEGCRYHEEVGDTVLDGTCRLVAPSMAVHTWERARLRDDEGTVELREGTAMFDVTEVEAGQPPTRIRVSHGIIEVLGTRFTIEQGPRGGHVDLFEGRIRFIGLDGSSTEIAPGQRYTWGETLAALTLTPPPTGPTLEPSMAAAGAAGGEASTEPAE